MPATGPIATFGSITGGSGYANGTYKNVPLTGGNGSGAFANITVSGGVVTVVVLPTPSASAVLDRTGKNYQVADALSANANFDGVGSGSNFSVPVATLAKACENCFFGRIVAEETSPSYGLRYCANNAFDNRQAIYTHDWTPLITPDNFWCGEGADLPTGTSFSSAVVQLPANQNYSPSAWTPYVPTLSAGSGSLTSAAVNGRYVAQGKTINFNVTIAITTNGTAAGTLNVTLPVTPNGAGMCVGQVAGTAKAVTGIIETSPSPIMLITLYDGTYPGANGAVIELSGTYESI